MDIGIIGINHKVADVTLREQLAHAFQRHFFFPNAFLDGSFILLSTCNRSELYFSSENLAATHQDIVKILKTEIDVPFEQKLYTFFGIDCFTHLALVTAGLDSAIIAETEIQGQVRQAYETASKQRSISKELHYLFQKCLKTGKEIRSHYLETKQLPDLEHVLLHYATSYFENRLPSPLFIGASEINLKIASFFKKKGIHSFSLCNRRDIGSKNDLQATLIPWSELQTSWQNFDWIICATKCPHFILQESHSENTLPKLLIDLSVPRNICPSLETSSTKLLNIDDLQRLLDTRIKALDESVQHAQNAISLKVKNAMHLFHANKSPRALPICV